MFSIDNRHLSTAGSSLAPVYISNFPIHYAIRSCDCSSAVELIETSHKADALTLSAFDFYGDSPLQLAVQNKLGSIIDVLVLFGAKTEAINSRGDSLRKALEKCQFRFALFAKVEVDSKSKRSRPTLNLARSVNLLQAIENEPFAKGEKRPVLKRTRPSTSLSLGATPRPSLKTDELPTSRRSRGFSTDSFSLFTRPLSATMGSTSPEQCPYSFEMVPYLHAVKKMLEEQKVDLLAHTYFIFFDEDILFDYLLQMGEKHKKPISGFLVTLML
ncbi:MAG: hypothetical protein JSR39_09830, partial [Verrucomicrobia bacterium]|nr:hypothetical protein [Verrucomicrobiota bacterium]